MNDPNETTDDDVLLTHEQVIEWQRRYAEVQQQMKALREEERWLGRRIAAARTLMGNDDV